MILLIAIILIFVILSLLNFFQPKSSFYYYNNVVAMAQGACTSTQGSTNLQFDNPNAVVFQIYDNATCDALLQSKPKMFSSPFTPSAGSGGFQLCYAVLKGDTNLGQQFYFSSTYTAPVYVLSPPLPYTVLPLYSGGKYGNQFSSYGISGIGVNATRNDQTDTQLSLSASSSGTTMTFPLGYEFRLMFYSNVSSTVTLFYGNQGCQSPVESYTQGSPPLSLSFYNPCTTGFSSVSILVQPVYSGANQPAVSYEFNLSAQQSVFTQPLAEAALYDQCNGIPSAVSSGEFKNGTIVCSPITCGSTSLPLADTEDHVFEALFGGTYPFFGVEAGLSDLQILNPNSEQLSIGPLVGTSTSGIPFAPFSLLSQTCNSTGLYLELSNGLPNIIIGTPGPATITASSGISATTPSATSSGSLSNGESFLLKFVGDSCNAAGISYGATISIPFWADYPYVGNYTSLANGTISGLSTGAGITTTTFSESGVPPTYYSSWQALYDGLTKSASPGTNIAFSTSPGTYTASFSTPGYACTAGGSYTSGSTNAISSWTCTTTFTESGLPSGTTWSVLYSTINVTSSSVNHVIAGLAPGQYSFTIGSPTVSGTTYIPVPASGSLVAGNTKTITFSGASTQTKFTETGLPSNTHWSVLYDGINKSGTSSSITFSTGAGTFSFGVGFPTVSGTEYFPAPSSGTLTAGSTQAITYSSSPSSVVTFVESGIPSSVLSSVGWNVTYNVSMYSGSSSSISVGTTGSNLAYIIWPVTNSSANPAVPGALRVIGDEGDVSGLVKYVAGNTSLQNVIKAYYNTSNAIVTGSATLSGYSDLHFMHITNYTDFQKTVTPTIDSIYKGITIDFETWPQTPSTEQQHVFNYINLSATLANKYSLVAIGAVGTDIVGAIGYMDTSCTGSAYLKYICLNVSGIGSEHTQGWTTQTQAVQASLSEFDYQLSNSVKQSYQGNPNSYWETGGVTSDRSNSPTEIYNAVVSGLQYVNGFWFNSGSSSNANESKAFWLVYKYAQTQPCTTVYIPIPKDSSGTASAGSVINVQFAAKTYGKCT